MQKPNDPDDYELRDEYDLSKMTIVAKGRYAPHRRVGKNVVLLAPDVVLLPFQQRCRRSESHRVDKQKRLCLIVYPTR